MTSLKAHRAEIIDAVVRTRQWRRDEHTLLQHIQRSITGCEEVIHELQDEAGKFKKEPADDWKKKAAVVGRRSAHPSKRSTLVKLGEDVDDFRDNLSVILQALQLKEHQNTQNVVDVVQAIVKNVQAQNVSAEVRRWLRAPDATVDLNIASAKRRADTGRWLVQDPAFTRWLQRDNPFLWLYGFAGCGKSVLCSTAIQYTFRHQQGHTDHAAAFLFFTFDDDSKQDASAALRALLLQLCGQIAGLEAHLTRLKELYNHGTPPVPILMEYLRYAVTRCRHVYILLDALDESPAETARTGVVSIIESMPHWQLPGLHLLVTSRDVPDIRDHLQCAAISQDTEYIALKDDSVHQDILQYVSYQVDHDPQLRRWGDHREKIKSHLAEHADGVFRWVECQLRPLRQCARSERQLHKCLHTLPRSLDVTYERMLCNTRVESQEEARQILSLLCFSSRPLHVDEVIEAVAVDLDELECYDSRNKFASGDDLVRICPGLIDISHEPLAKEDSIFQSERDKGQEFTSTPTVRIAHFSAQGYLLSDRIKGSRASGFALSAPTQHGRISKACLLYSHNDDFVRQALTPGLVRQYALAGYAAQHWHHHYRQAGYELVSQLSERIIKLLTTSHTLDRWVRLHNPDRPWENRVNYDGPTEDHASPTYYASLLGCDSVLTGILSKSLAGVNAQGGNDGTALQAASRGGQEKIVQTLLGAGADVNAQGGEYGTALQSGWSREGGADTTGQGRYSSRGSMKSSSR